MADAPRLVEYMHTATSIRTTILQLEQELQSILQKQRSFTSDLASIAPAVVFACSLDCNALLLLRGRLRHDLHWQRDLCAYANAP